MKPWENVKRRRHRKQFMVATGLVIILIIAVFMSLTPKVTVRHDKITVETPATRNAKRTADLSAIKSALLSYIKDHNSLPVSLGNTNVICNSQSVNCKSAKLVDLNFLVTNATQLASIPSDPIGGVGAYGSGYTISQTNGIIELAAPNAEDGKQITVTVK